MNRIELTTLVSGLWNKVKSYVTASIAGKQDTISDIATIRSGAAAGATAVQPAALEAKQDKRTVETPTITASWVYTDNGNPFTAQELEDLLDTYSADWRNEAAAMTLYNALVAGNGATVTLTKKNYQAFATAAVEFDVEGYDSFEPQNDVTNLVPLTPTNYVVFGSTDSLAPVIANVEYTQADEFLFSFVCESDNCALTLPNGIYYGNGLDFDADKAAGRRFQVSICDGIALYAFVDNSNS